MSVAIAPFDPDPYLALYLEKDTKILLQLKNPEVLQLLVTLKRNLPLLSTAKLRLLYYINIITFIQRLYIPSCMTLDILVIAHRNGYPSFSCYYEIIICLWFIQDLIKMLWKFFRHCSECVMLQTKKYLSYGSIQSIDLSPVPFYTLMFDFILALPLASKRFNALMLVIYKFFKHISFIKEIDIWSTKQ